MPNSSPEVNPLIAPQRFVFDPTVNLGHVITFIGFVLTILVSWSTLDKRLALLEAARADQVLRDANQDVVTKESLAQINHHLGKIDDKLDVLTEQDGLRRSHETH